MFISPFGIRSIWLRHDLACFKDWLKVLAVHIAETGKEEKQEAHRTIETEHPGYLCPQDAFCVGILKGVERVNQQTYVDTYSKVAY